MLQNDIPDNVALYNRLCSYGPEDWGHVKGIMGSYVEFESGRVSITNNLRYSLLYRATQLISGCGGIQANRKRQEKGCIGHINQINRNRKRLEITAQSIRFEFD